MNVFLQKFIQLIQIPFLNHLHRTVFDGDDSYNFLYFNATTFIIHCSVRCFLYKVIFDPGFIETDMTEELNEKQKEAILSQVPLGRMGSAQEVAWAVRFLVSDHAAYITGTTLHVNGGLY